MSARDHPLGEYRYLPGIDPYSCGVIATPGWEIVHVTLARQIPWHNGLLQVRDYLEALGRTRHSLCAVELRCPKPYSIDGFIEFNQRYCELLENWEMVIDGYNPLARTNVAPVENPPEEPVLHGFSYCEPSGTSRPTFVVAGAGELVEGTLESNGIIRLRETSEDALMEKARYVVQVMRERLAGLEANGEGLTTIDVYSAHPLHRVMAEVIVPGLPAAAQQGVRWFYSRPPVLDIEFEMDMRGVLRDVVIELG